MNVVFLDYDGVVNTPMWEYDPAKKKWKCRYGQPWDGKVNNTQAVQWVSEFCENHHYAIVVTSTWRIDDDKWRHYLEWAGLRNTVEIIGRTPVLSDKKRGDEISAYLAEHPEITGYLIFDDETDMGEHITRLVRCDPGHGFGLPEYNMAYLLHCAYNAEEKI